MGKLERKRPERRGTYVRGRVVVEVVRSNCEICEIVDLKINGKEAYIFDFGTSEDIAPDKAPPCGCGERVFTPDPKAFSPLVMEHYGLTRKDVTDLLWIFRNEFYIGHCARCR